MEINIAGLECCRFASLRLDNAMQHYATRVITTLRRSLGCAVLWGQVGGWWRNAIVERLFLTLERVGFQRMPSSTGSRPNDPLRGGGGISAVEMEVSYELLVDLVDVLVANYNATPHKSLFGETPLDVLRQHVKSSSRSCVPRSPVPITANSPRLGISAERAKIKGRLSTGSRPYIEIDEARYTGEGLSGRFDLIDQWVTVHIDESDMRSIEAFDANGWALGKLEPLESRWRISMHSRGLRKAINAATRNRLLVVDDHVDPVDALGMRLAKEALANRKRRPAKASRPGTHLAGIAHASGRDVADIQSVKRVDKALGRPKRPLPRNAVGPKW